MWELEERHLQEKHQQLKQQLKDQYFMQRHQLLKRHEKVRFQEKSSDRTCCLISITCSIYKLHACVCVAGDGADAEIQPAVGRRDEEQTDSREGSSAQDSAQRGQDPHGHVQEESSHHCHCLHHPRAREGACKAGTHTRGAYCNNVIYSIVNKLGLFFHSPFHLYHCIIMFITLIVLLDSLV